MEFSKNTPSDVPTKKGIRMVFVMKRKITSELMTTYFPTILLTAITFATTFFRPLFFEAALSVNLTTMLVMTTIFISKLESLPPTSDIKMIDIWLILCQMVPFAEVVLLTGMEYHRRDATHEEKSRKNITEDDLEGKHCQKCWSPDLKTLGRSVLLMLQNIPFKLKTISDWIIKYLRPRKEDTTVSGSGKLHGVLWTCSHVLFWLLNLSQYYY